MTEQPLPGTGSVWGLDARSRLAALSEIRTGTVHDLGTDASVHQGSHIDGLAHIHCDGRMYGGARTRDEYGDFGWRHLGAETIPPIVARGVLLDVAGTLGSDTSGTEPHPIADPAASTHEAMLVRRGVLLLEILDLESLARERAYTFLFICLPLKIVGGTGSWVPPDRHRLGTRIARRWTLLDRSAAPSLLPLCARRGIRVLAAGG